MTLKQNKLLLTLYFFPQHAGSVVMVPRTGVLFKITWELIRIFRDISLYTVLKLNIIQHDIHSGHRWFEWQIQLQREQFWHSFWLNTLLFSSLLLPSCCIHSKVPHFGTIRAHLIYSSQIKQWSCFKYEPGCYRLPIQCVYIKTARRGIFLPCILQVDCQ